MEISSKQMPKAYLENAHHANEKANEVSNKDKKEENIVETMEKAAVEVALSMNAQIVLFAMDATQLNKGNITAQKDIFHFLAGKKPEEGLSLKDIGYEGKPITELTPDEATELIGENGFFGINQTSDRVANFALGFSDDPDVIKQALEGIKQGFKEAEELWGGELPEISYQTQARTVELIEKRLAELEGTSNKEETVEKATEE